MLARGCGKTDIHNLEPEDLAALTLEASAMAELPLAGTNWVVGQQPEMREMLDRLAAIERRLMMGESGGALPNVAAGTAPITVQMPE